MSEHYEYVRATVSVTDGSMVMRYKIAGAPAGSMSHDENVSEWTDGEIRDVVGGLLGVPEAIRDTIEVIWD